MQGTLGFPSPGRDQQPTVRRCPTASDPPQGAFSKRRAEFVGCYDTESEACETGYRSPVGRRFLVKAVLEEDPVISIPWAAPANHL